MVQPNTCAHAIYPSPLKSLHVPSSLPRPPYYYIRATYSPFLLASHPFTPNPAVKELQARDRLVVRDHVSRAVDPHEREVAARFNFSDRSAVAVKLQEAPVDLVVSSLARPFESLGPGFVAEPVADEISIALHVLLALLSSVGVRSTGESTYSVD